MSNIPISDYALLSDCHTASLVSRSGSIDWLCLPHFDSPSIFGKLLDEEAGYWSITPEGDFTVKRRYLDNSMVLETTFETPSGVVQLTDALATGPNERGHHLGENAPRLLLRRVLCTRGKVDLLFTLAPRPEYGLVYPLFWSEEYGLAIQGGANVLRLSAEVPLSFSQNSAYARFTLCQGERATFALHHRQSWEKPPTFFTPEEIEHRLWDTAEAWRSWASTHQRYQGPFSELVTLSGRVLQALTFYPTGAIIAAPTTSLPENPGGVRNWDYRYTWVRDASLTLNALWVAACPDEVHKFFDFLAKVATVRMLHGAHIQIMFGIGGEHDLTERELPHLSGWRDSRPVRIGNKAFQQNQLDVYGELLGAAYRLKDQLEEHLDNITRRFLIEAVDTAGASWREKDHGIWEIRAAPRDYLYSKLMCWLALHRGISLAGLLGAEEKVDGWRVTREEIRREILARGFNRERGFFAQSFDSDVLDASALVIPLVGFLPPDDPRVRSTLSAIEEHLTDPYGLVYRYRAPDGLPGGEGSFLLCTFWLAQVQALTGQLDRAEETFRKAASFVNDVGLLAEEVDPRTHELLGNFPQAFSHIGLINAAWAIDRARMGQEPAPNHVFDSSKPFHGSCE